MNRTAFFDAVKHNPKHPGRYLYKFSGARPVFRWWTGKGWQLNRRKSLAFHPRAGDTWAGAVELHPEVKAMIDSGAAASGFQPVKLDLLNSSCISFF